jgi:hypothetical protein
MHLGFLLEECWPSMRLRENTPRSQTPLIIVTVPPWPYHRNLHTPSTQMPPAPLDQSPFPSSLENNSKPQVLHAAVTRHNALISCALHSRDNRCEDPPSIGNIRRPQHFAFECIKSRGQQESGLSHNPKSELLSRLQMSKRRVAAPYKGMRNG